MQPYITCLYCLLLSVNLVFFLLCEMEGMHALSSGEMYPKLGYELKIYIYIRPLCYNNPNNDYYIYYI